MKAATPPAMRICGGRFGRLAETADPPATFGDSRADFSVNIQTEISGTIADGRLYRAGSAFWFFHRT
jgi:hypothetical protein